MKNEDQIVELLSELLIRQERSEESQERLIAIQEKLIAIQERQERLLIKILEILSDDVPKFD